MDTNPKNELVLCPWLLKDLLRRWLQFEILEMVSAALIPAGLSSVEPPPSSPAQEALDLLFSCGGVEEASGSPARGPLSEAELALFDPFSKEGNQWRWTGAGAGAPGAREGDWNPASLDDPSLYKAGKDTLGHTLAAPVSI